jgi:hypothetical protein
MDPVDALNLTSYTCEFCNKKMTPPSDFEVPDSERMNFSFIQLSEDDLDSEHKDPHVVPSLEQPAEIEEDLLSIPGTYTTMHCFKNISTLFIIRVNEIGKFVSLFSSPLLSVSHIRATRDCFSVI